MPQNEVVDAILSRRSTREGYVARPIDRSVLETIVRCGGSAPSSKNAKPWRFHVVSNRAALAGIAHDVEHAPGADSYVPTDPRTGRPREDWPSTVAQSAEVVRRVSVCIFVENKGVFSLGRSYLATRPREVLQEALAGYTFEVLGLGASIENVVLATHSLGLACAFMGDVVVAEEAIRRRLKIEGDLVGVIAIGHVEHELNPSARDVDVADPEVAVWH